ncbi:MAG: DNA-3-methyladenine glycosylase [Acidimicrobiales bacterium]
MVPGAPARWLARDGDVANAGSSSGLAYLDESWREILEGDPVDVATRLLGKVLVSGALTGPVVAGRIVEVEAYGGGEDPASHAYRGQTARNRTMFGRAGLLYVYLSYGIHHCCNVVCRPETVAGAVLVRALEPVMGLDIMTERRMPHRQELLDPLRGEPTGTRTAMAQPGRREAMPRVERELCSGPGKLCQALDINKRDDGTDLFDPASAIRLAGDFHAPPGPETNTTSGGGHVGIGSGAHSPVVVAGPRVGLSPSLESAGKPWRWWIESSPHVSARRIAGWPIPLR